MNWIIWGVMLLVACLLIGCASPAPSQPRKHQPEPEDTMYAETPPHGIERG